MNVFVTGGTGYIGRACIPALLSRGHRVRTLVRPQSRGRVPPGAEIIEGDALDAGTFADAVHPGSTLLQLVGTPSPSPTKAAEFERIDLGSLRASLQAARSQNVSHFVYLSVAQPAPVMRVYVNARARGEAMIRESGLPHTMLRPWYVIGPAHRWPLVLAPLYSLLRVIPATRGGATRLGLITIAQMVSAIVHAVENPASDFGGRRIVEVPELIRLGQP
ncbi:MAG: SDR family oxidoreductase [Gemmatimonadota bacterium]